MIGTLIMTFLSGATSGFLVGKTTAEAPPTPVEEFLLKIQRDYPDVTPEDLAEAKKIYEEYDRRVLELTDQAKDLLRDQLDWVKNHSQKKVDAILEKYPTPERGSK
jgi:hypothetical protein